MAAVKKGLGRGLEALLDPYIEEKKEDAAGSVVEISITEIDTNKQQPRKSFDEEKIKELAASIRQHGIIQPLIVKKTKERYLIVAGERRFRAARVAGLKKVPAICVEYDDEKLAEVALIENIQRENLNPVEEAAAIKFLMKQHELTQEEVSDKLGKSRPAVANSLRLLNLPEEILELVRKGILSAGHGRALAGIKDATLQGKIALECIRLGYSVRALETRIKNAEKEKKEKPAKEVRSNDLVQAEKSFRDRLKTKVKIEGGESKGKITIEYYSADDLQNIYSCIMGE